MTNGPPGRDGPFEDQNSKVERLVRTRPSIRSASPFADDELTLGEFIAAKSRAYKTCNLRTASALGAHFACESTPVEFLNWAAHELSMTEPNSDWKRSMRGKFLKGSTT